MEQSVRSFSSFVRAAPPAPRTGVHKLSQTESSDSSAHSCSVNKPSVDSLILGPMSEYDLWTVPLEWDWDNTSPLTPTFKSTSHLQDREVCPLIPEPLSASREFMFGDSAWSNHSPSISHSIRNINGDSFRDELETPRHAHLVIPQTQRVVRNTR